MSMSDYITLIEVAYDIEALNKIVEMAANDDGITNDEYELIYQTAVASV